MNLTIDNAVEVVECPEGVEKKEAGEAGFGLFATKVFLVGDVIFELTGEIAPLNPSGVDPVFDNVTGKVIFAGEKALNIGKDKSGQDLFLQSNMPGFIDDHLNHSFYPTCYMYIENGRVYLKALSDIKPGEELTFSYSFTEADTRRQRCDFIDNGTGLYVGGFNNEDEEEQFRIACSGKLLPHLLIEYVNKINDAETRNLILSNYPDDYLLANNFIEV